MPIIEQDEGRVGEIADAWILTVIWGDATDPGILEQPGIVDADTVAGSTELTGPILAVCLLADNSRVKFERSPVFISGCTGRTTSSWIPSSTPNGRARESRPTGSPERRSRLWQPSLEVSKFRRSPSPRAHLRPGERSRISLSRKERRSSLTRMVILSEPVAVNTRDLRIAQYR